LILREIGDLPEEHQAVLFGFLASDMSADLGLDMVSTARKQIVCTSRLNVETLRDGGTFKPELLHLIIGAKIQIPPMRERSDLEAILNDHLSRIAGEDHSFSKSARDTLLNYDWPGNLPEIVSAIKYAAVCCDGGVIDLDHLPQNIAHPEVRLDQVVRTETLPPRRVASTLSLNVSRADAERQRIMQALVSAGWHVSHAAKVIGVSRATMHRKMKALGIERPTL
jgi:transcriptional regulator of acetoin/glycerol metabolism